jgi:hypothetical protein
MTTVIGDPMRSGRTALAVTLGLLALAAALAGLHVKRAGSRGPANRSRGASRRGLRGGSGRDGLTGGPDLGRASPAGTRGATSREG